MLDVAFLVVWLFNVLIWLMVWLAAEHWLPCMMLSLKICAIRPKLSASGFA